MQVTIGPRVARRVLRYELERLCDQAGLTHAQAGERLGMSRTAFAHIISGRNLPNQPALEILTAHVGKPDRLPTMIDLLSVARLRSGQRGTVEQDVESSSTMKDFDLAIGLEAFARSINVFEPMLITGLLQTEAYARELINYHASITSGVDIEASVALRMRRQAVIHTQHAPTELWCVLEESALRRPVGDVDVMSRQYDHLLKMIKKPNVHIQVVPATVGVHPALSGAIYLLLLDADWRVGYEETRRSAYYHDEPDAVADYEQVMNHLRHLALDPKQSAMLIQRMREEIQ